MQPQERAVPKAGEEVRAARPRAWPIRWWLGLFTVAVLLPPLLLLGWTFASQIRQEELNARETAVRTARSSAADLVALHHQSLDLLERMSGRPRIRDFGGGDCDSLFAVVDFMPRFPDLLLFDADGRLVCSAVPAPGETAFARETQNWIASEIARGRLEPFLPMLRPIRGRWVSAVGREIRTTSGVHGGTLVVVELPEIAERASLPKDAVMTVIDSRGVILARSDDPELWIGRNVGDTSVGSAALRTREGWVEGRGVDGTRRQYGFAEVPELGWHIYVGLPEDLVMRPVRTMIERSVVAAGAVVAIVILLAAVFSGRITRPINAVSRAAHEIAKGRYLTIDDVEGPEEMQTMARAFNDMVASRAAAEHQMVENERSLKALSDRLLVVQEGERTRIARELHDDLGQSLTALKMDVTGLLSGETDSGSTPAQRERIVRTLDATLTAVQRISSELRPSVLDDLGLIEAIQSEARLFEERTGIECDCSLPVSIEIEPEVTTAIYRIFQEALTNVARHADASRTEVRLRARPKEVLLDVRDDGRGVTPEQIADAQSIGLIGMRERAEILGGSMRVEGVEGRGTIVSVRIPLAAERRA